MNILIVLIYFAFLLGIGYHNSKKESSEDFLIANRDIKWPTLAATLGGSYIGGGALIILASWSFTFGLSVFWIFAGVIAGFIFFIFKGSAIKKLSDEKKFHTISDYIYYKFDNKTGLLSTVMIFSYFFCWLLLQFVAGGIILSTLLGTSYSFAVLSMGIIILIYLLLSGFKAVVKTDFFQFLILFLLGIIILGVSIKGINLTPEQMNFFSGTGGITGAIAFLVIGMITNITSGDIWQRIYAAKNEKHLKKGLIAAAIFVGILGTVVASIGLWVKTNFPTALADDAIIVGLQNMLPEALLGVSLLIVLSSLMSTADTIIFAMSMNLSKDIMYHFKKSNEEELVRLTKISTFILVAISVTIALLTTSAASLGLITAAVIFPIGPMVLGSFFFKVKNKAALYSTLTGMLTFLGLLLFYVIDDITVSLPFFVSLVVLIILQAVIKK